MNWIKLIQDLTDHGLTQIQIAAHCNTGQGYISSIYRGKRKCPNWYLGEALRKLHEEVCGHDAALPIDPGKLKSHTRRMVNLG